MEAIKEKIIEISSLNIDGNLLIKRFSNAKEVVDTVAANDKVTLVTNVAEQYLEQKGIGFKIISQVCVVIDEIFSNIANYAYKEDKGPVKVIIDIDSNNVFRLLFVDGGKRFNPLEKEDPNIAASAEERDIGGLGIFIVKNLMDNVEYFYQNNLNILLLSKQL